MNNPVSPIDWPTITIGDRTYTLRQSFAASYQLGRWGVLLGGADYLQVAASQAGNYDENGKWKSAGFKSYMEFMDLISETPPDEILALVNRIQDAAREAEKKALRLPENSANPETAQTAA